MGELDRVATTGFSKMSDRQLGLWDIRDPKEPIGGFEMLDSISGVCIPFWDDSTQCLYLAGKGFGSPSVCGRVEANMKLVMVIFDTLNTHKISSSPYLNISRRIPKEGWHSYLNGASTPMKMR